MNLLSWLRLSADNMAPGAVESYGVRMMRKLRKRRTPIAADASPSDLASHHTWQEPSASDVTIRKWQRKRQLEKAKGRNLDPFEEGAGLEAGST